MDEGADPELAAEESDSPLFVAAANGNSEVVRLLIEKGAQVGQPSQLLLVCELEGCGFAYLRFGFFLSDLCASCNISDKMHCIALHFEFLGGPGVLWMARKGGKGGGARDRLHLFELMNCPSKGVTASH